MRTRQRDDRRQEFDGRADVAEVVVDGVRERVHGGRLAVPDHDDAGAAVRAQVGDEARKPCLGDDAGGRRRGGDAERVRDRPHELDHMSTPQWQSVIRGGAGERRSAFRDVDATALSAGGEGVAGRREIVRVPHRTRERIEKVGVESDDDARAVEPVDRLERATEGELRSVVHRVAGERLPRVPLDARIAPAYRVELPRHGGRTDGFGQDVQSFAAALVSHA